MKFIIPLGVSYLFIIVNGRIPILMLAAMQSDRAVAVFNAAYRFFDLSAMLGAALVVPFIPLFSGKAHTEQETLKGMLVAIIETFAVFLIPVAIIVPCFSPFIVTAFFGHAFAESAQVLNVIAWVCVVVFYSLFTSAAALALGLVNFSYWNTGCAALLSVSLNYLLIPRLSYLGSAWTSLVCELFLSGVAITVVMGRLGNVFRGRKWLQIACLNLAAAGLLHAEAIPLPQAFKALIIIVLYALAVRQLGLVSMGSFISVFHGKPLFGQLASRDGQGPSDGARSRRGIISLGAVCVGREAGPSVPRRAVDGRDCLQKRTKSRSEGTTFLRDPKEELQTFVNDALRGRRRLRLLEAGCGAVSHIRIDNVGERHGHRSLPRAACPEYTISRKRSSVISRVIPFRRKPSM